jgi:serine/threonine protein kinase
MPRSRGVVGYNRRVSGSSQAPPEGAQLGDQLLPVRPADREFGRYLLGYEIGSGGMATVYLARARSGDGRERPVAIKRIHPHLAKQRALVEMFLDEAKLNARLEHPSVCKVLDYGEVDGTYFIAMEYLVGQPMSDVLDAATMRGGLLGTPRWNAIVARIIARAAEGLHAAHELVDENDRPLGVVHRDVTPHNVFVTYDGAVKVLDFGVAWAEGRLHRTETGMVKGKFAYMSPEQVGAKRKVDRRSDIWALGACFWELLAGRRLFDKTTDIELLQAITRDPILPVSVVQPGVPLALDGIAMRALERDPEERYETALAMASELRAYLAASGTTENRAELASLMSELFAEEQRAEKGAVAIVLRAEGATSPAAPVRRRPSSSSETKAAKPGAIAAESGVAPVVAPRAEPRRPKPRYVPEEPSWLRRAALSELPATAPRRGFGVLIASAAAIAMVVRDRLSHESVRREAETGERSEVRR